MVNDLLQLRAKGHVQGDIQAGRLQIEPTAQFNGNCNTGAAVVPLQYEAENMAAGG
jgi:cytoskeletal protein CcmA (bactofilin family)